MADFTNLSNDEINSIFDMFGLETQEQRARFNRLGRSSAEPEPTVTFVVRLSDSSLPAPTVPYSSQVTDF